MSLKGEEGLQAPSPVSTRAELLYFYELLDFCLRFLLLKRFQLFKKFEMHEFIFNLLALQVERIEHGEK